VLELGPARCITCCVERDQLMPIELDPNSSQFFIAASIPRLSEFESTPEARCETILEFGLQLAPAHSHSERRTRVLSNEFAFLLRGHDADPQRELQGERCGPGPRFRVSSKRWLYRTSAYSSVNARLP
jgi:hypothetical protein